ncbi:DnaJ C-terminal domain-containing protein [Niveispirillum sp. KHB5.9]|uniref:DnaJ C-terminal domain-containing protein n=1 Tax=Niveispirillum sp. KHB5.9 TaxID=3400269 RepID=UPI003A849FB1
MRDPYLVLGITRSASADDIKQAFRRLAKQYHPDLNPGRPDIEQKFKEVNGAYSLLSDPDKRARFDKGEIDAGGSERPDRGFRRAWQNAGRTGPGAGPRGPGAGGRTGGDSADDPFADDFFNDIFGATKRRYSAGGGAGVKAKGSDVNYSVSVSFADACLGAKRRLTLSTGKTIEVNIPPGTRDQTKLRLKGQGLAGLGGAGAGDAIVEVLVDNHPLFTRKDDDIHLDVPVTLAEAVLGAAIKVPTLDGQVAVKVPAGANSGTVLRLKGKGIPNPDRKVTGDLYVKLVVMLPEKPDAELSGFIERWSKGKDYDVRRKLGV